MLLAVLPDTLGTLVRSVGSDTHIYSESRCCVSFQVSPKRNFISNLQLCSSVNLSFQNIVQNVIIVSH